MKKQIISEEFKKMQKLAGVLNEEATINFDELKKHQAAIRNEQNYLLDISKKLNIDNKLVGDFNKALNDLIEAIFEKNK